MKPYAYDPEKAKKLLAEAGYPNGFEFEWTTSQNESWGLPIVEAVIPMLAKVGIKVKPKLVEVTVLTDIAMKGEFQAFIGSSLTGPDSLGDAALLPFQDAAHGLQLHRLQESRLRQAARRGRPGRRHGQAQRAAEQGQRPPLRGSAGVVLQLQQGRAGLSAVDPRPAGQPDRDHAPVSGGHLGRRSARRRSDGEAVTPSEAASRGVFLQVPPLAAARTSAGDANRMLFVLARRLANIVPTLVAVVALVFLLFSVLPGSFISGMNEDGRTTIDPAVMERMRKEMGLDDPAARALRQLRGAHSPCGDLGISFRTARAGDQADRRSASGRRCKLVFAAMALRHRDRRAAGLHRRAAGPAAWSTPRRWSARSRACRCRKFWLGLMLMYLFALKLDWLPSFGYGDGGIRI